MGDTTDELLVDQLRNQLREATTKLDAVEKLKDQLATAANGGPSRELLMVTLSGVVAERDAARREAGEMKANPATDLLARKTVRCRELELELELDAKRATIVSLADELRPLRARLATLIAERDGAINEASALRRERDQLRICVADDNNTIASVSGIDKATMAPARKPRLSTLTAMMIAIACHSEVMNSPIAPRTTAD